MIRRISIAILLTLSMGFMAQAQPVMSVKALKEYQKDSLQQARTLIDSAVTLDIGKEDAWSWQVRGFVYKALFKQNRHSDSEYRPVAIESFRRALKYSNDEKVTENSKKGIRFFAQTYYNDAVRHMDTVKYLKAANYYRDFKETIKIIEPDKDLKKRDIQFWNTLAGIHQTIMENKRNPSDSLFQKTVETYQKVLELDSNNYRANYNIGIMYYNKSVDIVKNMNVDQMDLVMLRKKQDHCIDLFREALPYMKKAYELRPNNKEVLTGLSGIYFQLNEKEKSQHYDALRQELIDKEKGNKKQEEGSEKED